MNSFRSVLLVAVAAAGLLAPSATFAQDDGGAMTFGEEEAEEVQEGESEGAEGEGDATETAAEGATQGGDNPVVGVVAAPSSAVSSSQRATLQEELVKQLQNVPDIQLDSGSAVLDALRKRTVETCVTEPLCLGTVGEEAGVDYIAMVRVTEQDTGFKADLDYFQVSDRLFEKLRSEDELASIGAVQDQIKPLVEDMFGLGTRESPDYAEDDTGAATTVVAISSAVLSAGGIVGGIVFGNQASQAEQDLKSFEKNDSGVYKELNQPEARRKLEDAQGKAQTANIFYGLAGAFAVTSGILFIVDSSGSNAGEKQEKASSLPRINVAPTAGPDGAGFSARIRF